MAAETEEIRGIGHSVRRVEDDRFIRGAGNYIDDIHLPGMLYMAILRSPYAHAKLNGIDPSRAQALEGVIAVVTGELMAQHNLAWMPTMSGDTQAVLVTDKVRFQGQEVAAVIATDPYVATDALELIDVDYEPLGVVVSPNSRPLRARPSSATRRKGRPTTTSTTGRRETRPRPTRRSPRPTRWSPSTPSTRVRTPPRSRRAGASRT